MNLLLCGYVERIRARHRAGRPGLVIFDPEKNLILNPEPSPDFKFSAETDLNPVFPEKPGPLPSPGKHNFGWNGTGWMKNGWLKSGHQKPDLDSVELFNLDSQKLLTRAADRIDSMFWFGIYEDLDRSLELLRFQVSSHYNIFSYN